MAGTVSLPGGKVEFGERLAEAVAREVLEETGLRIEVGPLLDVVEIQDAAQPSLGGADPGNPSAPGPAFHYVILDYLAWVAVDETAEPLAGDDASEVLVVPIERLDQVVLTPEVRRMIALALEKASAIGPTFRQTTL